jgi:hypothetical protein
MYLGRRFTAVINTKLRKNDKRTGALALFMVMVFSGRVTVHLITYM